MINSQFEEIQRHLLLLSFGKGETNTGEYSIDNMINSQFEDKPKYIRYLIIHGELERILLEY